MDWETAERGVAGDRERTLLRNLKIIAGIADMSRPSEAEPAILHESGRAAAETSTIDVSIGNHVLGGLSRRWGQLEIRRSLGAGAFGEVYCAWDSLLDREVALKLLDPERVYPGRRRPEVAARILEEGRLMARVRHSNVITIYGVEAKEGRIGLWMELIRGRTLEDLLREQGPLGAHEAANVGLELCRALTAVHRAGLVHRDVKATNVMREEGGRILLMDFGAGVDVRDDPGLPRGIAGTPYYMAPEVLRGEAATRQSDLYSLGVLLYHLVTGSYPAEGASVAELRSVHERQQMHLLREARPDFPEAFVRVVEKAFALNPVERFASAASMQEALAASQGLVVHEELTADLVSTAAVPNRKFGVLVAAASVLVAVGLGAGAWWWIVHRSTSGPSVQETGAVGGVPSAPGAYTAEASLYRVSTSGESQQLFPGSRIAPGNGLYLEFRASETVHVYVIDEDERGEAFLLFPLAGLETTNPLLAGVTHTLPGRRQGKLFAWEVTSVGGREHLLIVASRDRLTDFEADILALRQAGSEPESQYTQLSESAKGHLRGVGGLLEQAPSRATGAPTQRLFELASKLSSRAEAMQGIWVRHFDLENPTP